MDKLIILNYQKKNYKINILRGSIIIIIVTDDGLRVTIYDNVKMS